MFKLLQSRPLTSGIAAVLLTVVGIAGGVLAWGPDRPTFTTAKPADHITFNSITDNPAYGDERNFFRVKPAGADNSQYADKITLEPGKEYQGYVYFHNNAAANLNLVAENTSMRVELPAVVDGSAKTNAFISASNAKPLEVFDDATLQSSSAVALRMVPGSATIHSRGAVDGQKLADSLITDGVELGYNKLDGKVPGCNEFAGYVTFRFVADQPNFTVSKEVSKTGANKWVESYKAQPEETVDFLLEYKNTGTTIQNDVHVKDVLPQGMTYVAGSTVLGNPSNPQGVKTEDGVTKDGLNIGSYNPGQNAWIIFSAKVANKDSLKCGLSTMVNKQLVSTNNGSKSDTATVTVEKKCEEKPEVEKIKVCLVSDKKIITIDEKDFDTSKHSKNLSDCEKKPEVEKIKVCLVEDKQVISIDKGDFDESRHSKNLSLCEATPTTPATPVTPETPEELPQTGASDNMLSMLGLSALVTTSFAYVASRKNSLIG